MEMTMGMRIRECRVKMGMTQEELAEALFTKKCTISAYETGKIDVKVSEYSVAARFFRNHPFYPFDNISFAANSSLPQRPYMVRFIIFNLLFVPSTRPFDKGLATAFSTADKSFSSPEAKRESSLRSLFLYFSINRYKQGMLFR